MIVRCERQVLHLSSGYGDRAIAVAGFLNYRLWGEDIVSQPITTSLFAEGIRTLPQ